MGGYGAEETLTADDMEQGLEGLDGREKRLAGESGYWKIKGWVI